MLHLIAVCVKHMVSLRPSSEALFTAFYTLYFLIVAVAIVVWITIRRLQ